MNFLHDVMHRRATCLATIERVHKVVQIVAAQDEWERRRD